MKNKTTGNSFLLLLTAFIWGVAFVAQSVSMDYIGGFTFNAVRNLIREGKTFQITSVIQTSKRLGMQTMDDALYDLYMRRMIDGEAAVSYAQDPVAMNKKINFV